MLRSIAPLYKVVAAILIVALLIDVAIFHSGLYRNWIELDSTAGSLVGTDLAIDYYYAAGQKNILVLGNSKITEGFSAKLATIASHRADLHFINGAVPGTSPRVWDYQLREIDPDGDRFAAIAIMVDYDLDRDLNDLSNYSLDTNYLQPLLRISDFSEYPASFSDPDQRARARRAIALPLQALREDIVAFALHPLARIHKTRVVRPNWLGALDVYPGRTGALPSLQLDATTQLPIDWGDHPVETRAQLQGYFESLQRHATPAMIDANRAYLEHWIGAIAKRYGAHHVPIILFSVPRGPWQTQILCAPVADAVFGRIAAATQDVVMIPGDAFDDLEQPEFFFDRQHMNRSGREKFSQRFGALVAPIVP